MNEGFNRLCVIGLGYVGLPTAAVFATSGVEVVGVDIDSERVALVNLGVSPLAEPNLDTLVHKAVASGKLRAQERLTAADAFIIAVPTPLKGENAPDLSYLQNAAACLAPVLERGNLVVLESTSPVGTTESLCKWLAQARPDLSFPIARGEQSDIRLAYSPERVLPGQIIVELLNNDRIVGGMTPACAAAAAALYRTFSRGTCALTTARSAELAKLAENAYRDVNIAFANEIALACEALGVDPWELIELTNHHPRVNVLRPGPGVGGHCIAVDPWFIVHSLPNSTPLIRAARQVNDDKPRKVVDHVLTACRVTEDPTVACLGLTYKADVGDLRESPSIVVVRALQESMTGRLLVVDPYVDGLPQELVDGGQTELVELEEALMVADVIVLLTDHQRFRDIDSRQLDGKVAIDTRGVW